VLLNFEKNLQGKKILVTGHTGFTGGWVCSWLNLIGADVYGFSLEPDTNPSLFNELGLSKKINSHIGDICNFREFKETIDTIKPDLILHLAAQPLVRRSYYEPLETFLVNTQGTANVLESARMVSSVKGILCITTDKVYKNFEWDWPYRENDVLGGKDPYSASKSAAEMIIQSYSDSFSENNGGKLSIASARGGNIIGGGDWAEDRLIPDFVRALIKGDELIIRYPNAVRPWQHVLALVYAYLLILSGLISEDSKNFCRAWNLGPDHSTQFSVMDILRKMGELWKLPNLKISENLLPEAMSLSLDSSLANNQLNWRPVWGIEKVIHETIFWYRKFYEEPQSAYSITVEQINAWRDLIK
jgi:CDP-glucose 4,6-dehydratase